MQNEVSNADETGMVSKTVNLQLLIDLNQSLKPFQILLISFSDHLISLGGVNKTWTVHDIYSNPTVEISHFGTVNDKICHIDELPERVRRHSALHTSYGVILCGGIPFAYKRQIHTTKCHRLLPNGTWVFFPPLNSGRASFSLNEVNKRLIAVGDGPFFSTILSKPIDYIDFEIEANWKSTNFTFEIYDHCSLKFDNQTIWITGGIINGLVSMYSSFTKALYIRY